VEARAGGDGMSRSIAVMVAAALVVVLAAAGVGADDGGRRRVAFRSRGLCQWLYDHNHKND
jgi:hypothetical protein